MSIISNIIRKKTAFPDKQPTALCFFYDGKFDNELAQLGIKLIGPKDLSVYQWSDKIKSKNITFINENEINNHQYDFTIFNSLISHEKYILNLPLQLHLPSFIINHETNLETNYHLNQRIKQTNLEYYTTEYNNGQSMNSIIYGTKKFENINKKTQVLLSGNFREADYGLLKHLKLKIPNLTIMGENPKLDISTLPLDYENYKRAFAECNIYINLPTERCINYECLWAMANGSLVISLTTQELKKIIHSNNDNGVLCNNVDEIILAVKEHLINLKRPLYLDKIKKAEQISTIFSYENFKTQWTNIIQNFYKKVYYV